MAETPDIPPIPAAPSPLESPEPSPAPRNGDTGAEPAAAPTGWMAAVAPETAPAEPTVSPGPAAPEPAVHATPESAVAPAEGVASGELEDRPGAGSAATGVAIEAPSPSPPFPTAVEPLVEPTSVASEVSAVIAEPAPAAPPVAAPLEVPAAPAEPPGIATSVVVPPLPAGEAGEGGEWDLLLSKLRAWYDGADLQGRWESLGGPLRGAGLLLAAVVLLRLYSALLETLGDLPLVPRLLQLVGLVTVVHFGLTRLVRSSDRERILTTWQQRWNDFRGRD